MTKTKAPDILAFARTESEDDEGAEDSDLVEAVTVKLTTQSEWARSGTEFHPRTRADKCASLPPGVYRYAANMQGWWLERTGAAFEFPFKVYHAEGRILKRVAKFWEVNGGNLGILLNGLRGAGKTMTAQLLANQLIKRMKIPVLVVRGPIPLQIIFDAVQQHMMIIFDEFEKTHDDPHQQQLLSTIDGMSRSANNRLIIFTTNRTEINENFRDRPSRIHYRFEFNRVADEIIEGLIDDSLPKDLLHFKTDIFEFLNSRKICTIDIVKAVIAEVNTFKESPLQFEDMLNIAKGEPPAFTIEILNEAGLVQDTFSHFFRLENRHQTYASLLSGNKRSIQEFVDNGNVYNLRSQSWDGGCQIQLLEKCEEEFIWLAKLCGGRAKTIWKDFDFLGNQQLWYDNRPKGFKFPFTREIVRKDEKAMEALMELWDEVSCSGTVYGTGEMEIFKIKITPNRDIGAMPARYKVTGRLSKWDDLD